MADWKTIEGMSDYQFPIAMTKWKQIRATSNSTTMLRMIWNGNLRKHAADGGLHKISGGDYHLRNEEQPGKNIYLKRNSNVWETGIGLIFCVQRELFFSAWETNEWWKVTSVWRTCPASLWRSPRTWFLCELFCRGLCKAIFSVCWKLSPSILLEKFISALLANRIYCKSCSLVRNTKLESYGPTRSVSCLAPIPRTSEELHSTI